MIFLFELQSSRDVKKHHHTSLSSFGLKVPLTITAAAAAAMCEGCGATVTQLHKPGQFILLGSLLVGE